MKTNKIKPFISSLFLTALFVFFYSCNIKSNSNDNDQLTTASTISVESKNDTTRWLKESKDIRGIFEDSKGNLWFSNREFVCKYDGAGFRYFDEKDGLIGMASGVQEDAEGSIWISISLGDSLFGASSFDGKKFTFHPFDFASKSESWSISEGDIWFSKPVKRFGETPGPPGMYRYKNERFSFHAFPIKPYAGDDFGFMSTTRPFTGKDGTTWFGTFEAAIGFKDGEFTYIGRDQMGLKDDPQNIGIRALFEDSKGNLWIGDNGNGVFVYDGDTTINFTRLHKLDKEDTDGYSLHRIFSISEDNAGNMWFVTVYSGIWRFDGKAFTNFTKKDGLMSDVGWTIYKTKQGELLFSGGNPGAVYKFNGTSFERVY